jgi:hypothetical protein
MFDHVTSTFEVPKVTCLSRQEFEEQYLVPQRPVIISGAMEGWPAREQWTTEHLAEKVGARTFRPWRPDQSPCDTPLMTLAEYIDLVETKAISHGRLYAAQLTIKNTLPELWPDVRFPHFVDEDDYQVVNFWFGPGNNLTPLHYDPTNNFLAQIRGKKQMILCPPRETGRLYPFPLSYAANPYSRAANHMSQVDVVSPDLTRFPGWADAERAVVELNPGDILFIPFYWWHAVWGIELNMSINYWWRPRPAHVLQHPRQTAAMLAKRSVKVAKAIRGDRTSS